MSVVLRCFPHWYSSNSQLWSLCTSVLLVFSLVLLCLLVPLIIDPCLLVQLIVMNFLTPAPGCARMRVLRVCNTLHSQPNSMAAADGPHYSLALNAVAFPAYTLNSWLISPKNNWESFGCNGVVVCNVPLVFLKYLLHHRYSSLFRVACKCLVFKLIKYSMATFADQYIQMVGYIKV